jgi:Anti-anti-sigma regulatory factor (antagonist of anti-sigma factor)
MGEEPPRPGKKLPGKPAGDFMSLHIKMEQTSDVAVLQCCGRLVRGEALQLLKDAVTSLSRLRVVVLDLSEAEMLDGGGLGMLVFLHEWTRSSGIQLNLVNPSRLALEMLMRTRLTSVLHVSSIDDVVDLFCNSHRTTENVDRAAA